MKAIKIIQGSNLGSTYKLDIEGKTKIGRGKGNHIVLTGTKISRYHCEIVKTGDGHFLYDLQSANGTYVNFQKTRSGVELHSGDYIRCGPVTMLFDDYDRLSVHNVEDLSYFLARRLDDHSTNLSVPDSTTQSIFASEVDRSNFVIEASFSDADLNTLIGKREQSDIFQFQDINALSTLYELSNLLVKSAKPDLLLHDLCQLILRASGADFVHILLNADQEGLLETRLSLDKFGQPIEKPEISRTIISHVMERGETILTSDAMLDKRFNSGQSIAAFHIRSVMCASIKYQNQTTGFLYVDSKGLNCFSHEDLALLGIIGNIVGLFFENNRLIQKNMDSERLAGIGEAVSGMAHCIKNILTGIWGGRDLLETGLQIKDLHQIRIGWNVISQCLNNISDLVLNMLNFSKKREPIRKMENINKVVLDAITIIRGRSQQKKIEIETHFMANIPDMAIDALAIQRALLNLLINGVETIESIEDETQGRLIVTTHYDQPENHITIAISDNGPGIPESIRPHLFEMFSSSKGSKGTGLGLVVSKKIVNEHGGDLEVQSSPGQGATFTVILPREISLDATAE